MKKNVVFLLSSLILPISSHAVDGVIHFRGEIVAPPCQLNTDSQKQTMDTNCYKNGKMVRTIQNINSTSLNSETPVKTTLVPVKNYENLKFLVVEYE